MAGETALALDFEPGNFSRFSGVEQGSAAQSIIGTAQVRTGFGTKSCKFSNIPGVYWVNGSMRSLAARYDSNETTGQEYWWAGSLYFPSTDAMSYGQLLWELHHPSSLYSIQGLGVAPHALTFDGTNIKGRIFTGQGSSGGSWPIQRQPIVVATPPLNQWMDFIINIKLTEDNSGYVKWYVDETGTATFTLAAQETGIPTMPFTSSVRNVKLYTELGIYNSGGENASQSNTDSYYCAGWRRCTSYANAVAQFGSGGGGSSGEPPPGPIEPPGVPGEGGGIPVTPGGTPTTHNLAATPESEFRFKCGSKWRFVVTNLDGEAITTLDHLATDRVVTPKLNEPLEVSFTVPSDNREIIGGSAETGWGHTDGFPFLAEGVRQLYCLRREFDQAPYYRVRASALILQTTDAGDANPARTTVTAWDPWQYMMSRPVLISSYTPTDYGNPGEIIRVGGIRYPPNMVANEIALDMIRNTATFGNASAPTAAQAMFLDLDGTAENPAINEVCWDFPGDKAEDGFQIEQGTSLGVALQNLCGMAYMDIVLRPIYDPVNRPGLLCTVDIFNQFPPAEGAGDYRYGAVFAWDKPSRSIAAINDLIDGTQRANKIDYFADIGGEPIPTSVIDLPSIQTYGEYEVQQFYPKEALKPGVDALAKNELRLRSTFKQTVTVNPVPERAPQPFVDYGLGDRVPVYATNKLRQAIPPDGPVFGQLPVAPVAWQRVFSFPVEIDDNGVETVRELLCGPIGAPPPVVLPGAGGGTGPGQGGPPTAAFTVAVNTAAQTRARA